MITKQPKNKHRPLVLALQAAMATGFVLPTLPLWAAQTTRVSVNSTGTEGYGFSGYSSISADGRFVAFESSASLVVGDGNAASDIFVRDQATNKTTRLSVSSAGVQGNRYSVAPSISADGRFVAFESGATNLVTGDTNNVRDIFLRDRQTNQTTRVSVDSVGTQGNNNSYLPSISADGRFITFTSTASNLVTGDTNGFFDVFVHDRIAKITTRVSVNSVGVQGNDNSSKITGGYILNPSISSNGRFVAFTSSASNLVSDDSNAHADIFVHDRQTKQTTRVSLSSAGLQGNQSSYYNSISADGRFVAFISRAINLVSNDTNFSSDVFVRDRQTNSTTRVSVSSLGAQVTGSFYRPSISADGRFVTFDSAVDNLVPNDTNFIFDVFVRDRQTNQTTRVSVNSSGNQAGGSIYDDYFGSRKSSISADGRYVAFHSFTDNLVLNDGNTTPDAFVQDRLLTPAVTADLALTQTVSANPVTVGASFSYTATVKNNGSVNATNVVLTDFAPLNGTVGLPTLVPSQGNCYRGIVSICRLGTINAGQQATVQMTFSAKVKGAVANRITVSASPKDPTPFNSVTTSTTIVP